MDGPMIHRINQIESAIQHISEKVNDMSDRVNSLEMTTHHAIVPKELGEFLNGEKFEKEFKLCVRAETGRHLEEFSVIAGLDMRRIFQEGLKLGIKYGERGLP